MSRGSCRFRDHTLRPDESADAEPWTFAMQCRTCGVTGPTYQDPEHGTGWAARHLKVNPGHNSYREHITRPYRFEPGAWR